MDWNNINRDRDTSGLGPIEYDQTKVPALIRKHADNVRTKTYGQEVREAQARNAEYAGLVASEAVDISNETKNRQDSIETQFNSVQQELTDKDVISAPEIIAARNGEATLANRLDATDAQLAQNEKDLTQRALNIMKMPIPFNSAKGDGIFDDGVVINNALELVSGSYDTKTVYMPKPPVEYLVNTEIKIDGIGIRITGDGKQSTILKAGNSLTRSVFFSSREERTNVLTLLDVSIDNFGVEGTGQEIDGFILHGFNRGCKITDMFIEGFKGTALNISGSWSFQIARNVLRGYREKDSVDEWVYYGTCLSLGDGANNPHINHEIKEVNIPEITGNSFQFCTTGLRWVYGAGGSITGNTFENTGSYWFTLSYVRGLEMTGNYFESNNGIYGAFIGSSSSTEGCVGLIFEGNHFMPNDAIDIWVRNISYSRIKNNSHHANTSTHIGFSADSVEDLQKYNEFTIEHGKVFGLNRINHKLNMIKILSEDEKASTMNTIVDSGTNTNGYYVMYSDGTMICKLDSITIPINSNYNVTFPKTFTSPVRPIVAGDINSQDVRFYSGTGSSNVPIRAQRIDGSTKTEATLGYIAIGTWKQNQTVG